METDGGLIYGGLGFQVVGSEFRVTGSNGALPGQRPCPFTHQMTGPTFNRLSISSKPGSTTMAVNLHPMWTDKAGKILSQPVARPERC